MTWTKEDQKEYAREWYQRNKQLTKDRATKWNKDHKKARRIINGKRVRFLGARLQLKENPRTGICSKCSKEGLTHIHHLHYDRVNPLKDTIELCPSCHWGERS